MNWLLMGEGSMYRHPRAEKKFPDTVVEWLKHYQQEMDEKQRIWLEIQMKRCFPEYAEWLRQKEKGL